MDNTPLFADSHHVFRHCGFVSSKVQKKLTQIESRLVQKVEKETMEKEKNREQKLQRMKNEIDDMLHDGNR
ncbi:MAG TPA: hypothetical protein VN365_03765, partial [Candidatus Thermoplasmatota archaeon]|nr:hypothetical protein [Candidatus Thermoplasmatota archaeon]